MPVFSMILICILLYIIYGSKSKIDKYYELFALSCILKIYWFQGYFIKIGDREFAGVAVVAEFVLTLYAIYLLITNVITLKKRNICIYVFFALVNLLGIILEIVSPYEGLLLPYLTINDASWDDLVAGKCNMYNYYPSITDYTHSYLLLLHFGLNVILFKHLYDRDKFIRCYMKILKYLKYGLFYGVFEFAMKNIIGNLTITYDISSVVLGMNELNVYKEAFVKNGMYTLQGLTREPSHFNCYLFTFLLLAILENVIIKNKGKYSKFKSCDKWSIWVAILLLLLSGGFSAVWYLFILLGSYYIIKFSNRQRGFCVITPTKILSLTILCGVFVVISYIILQNDYFYNRLLDAFVVIDYIFDNDNIAFIGLLVENEGAGSTIARFFSTYTGIMIFLNRPLFGLGYCLQFVHSLSALLLANLGLVGVYSIYKLLTCGTSNKYDAILLFFVFIIGGLPITIAPIGFSMQWILIFEATTFYKNKWEDDLII